jgi:hypothetical protein
MEWLATQRDRTGALEACLTQPEYPLSAAVTRTTNLIERAISRRRT